MDFSIQRPVHIIALILLAVSFFLIIVFPIISYFAMPLSTTTSYIETIPESFETIFEILILLTQLLFVMGLFILVPIIWYHLVNKLSLKEMFSRLKLRKEGIDIAILWGIIAVIVAFGIIFVTGVFVEYFGYDLTDSSNITDLELYFSLPSIFLLLIIQPVGEEIFFRGFLLEKINFFTGEKIAIIATGILFGIAHLTYGKIYPAIMTAILGMIFGYIVIKTKNLYSAIIAHILFNVTSFTLYLLAQSLNLEALIL